MSVNIVRGTTTKPAAVGELVSIFASTATLSGELITGYPNLGGAPDEAVPDALWLSRQYGPVLFDVVEGNDLGDYEQRQDDIYRLYYSKLVQNRDLVQKRKLLADPQVLTFMPGIPAARARETTNVASASALLDVIDTLDEVNLTEEVYAHLLSAAQAVSSIRRSRQTRVVRDAGSRGSRLLELENSIATLDNRQQQAVIETVDGVQRIRGLAGSGKTIILALKVAYLHGRHPDWRIAVTFYTRSLKDQFKRLITTFCLEQNAAEPDWERIHVINAWGGRGGIDRSGMYKQFCDANGSTYFDLQSARSEFGPGADVFDQAVKLALKQTDDPKPIYDVILVDEAQDFPSSFLRMCYDMLSTERRLVYAYDELQSLTASGVPEPENIFGKNADGTPRVTLTQHEYDLGARRDVVLERCYRNSRPVLVSAHAVGFGVYREPPTDETSGLVQMFGQPHLWRDIGYHVADGELREGAYVALARSAESSPKFLETHSPALDLVSTHAFGSADEQNEWVAEQIKLNLEQDELRPDDIMVVSPNPFTARNRLGPLRGLLLEKGVKNHIAGVDYSTDIFFTPEADSVTFTGINRAKGNEAGMVYVVNAHEEFGSWNQAVVRNRLFTAITRSKAWVRVCGVGDDMAALQAEMSSVVSADWELRFDYPTAKERERLRIVHREMTADEHTSREATEQAMLQLLDRIDRGDVAIETLSPAVVEKLRAALGEVI